MGSFFNFIISLLFVVAGSEKSYSGHHSTLYKCTYLHPYISITPERETDSPGPASSSTCHLSCWCLLWVQAQYGILIDYMSICERKPEHALLGGHCLEAKRLTWRGEEDQVGSVFAPDEDAPAQAVLSAWHSVTLYTCILGWRSLNITWLYMNVCRLSNRAAHITPHVRLNDIWWPCTNSRGRN